MPTETATSYEVISTRVIDRADSPYDIGCLVRLRRSDGAEGHVLVRAGITPCLHGAARTSHDPITYGRYYWPVGGSLDCWIPRQFLSGGLSSEDVEAILTAAGEAAVREVR